VDWQASDHERMDSDRDLKRVCEKLGRAAFRLLQRPDDLVSKSLSVFEAKWRPGNAHASGNIDARPD